jgi:hypothetical protein
MRSVVFSACQGNFDQDPVQPFRSKISFLSETDPAGWLYPAIAMTSGSRGLLLNPGLFARGLLAIYVLSIATAPNWPVSSLR